MSNQISFVGTLGQDAETKVFQSGTTVLSFSVANNVGFGDKKVAMWFRVSVFGKRAESGLVDYLKKGQQVFISGEFSTREYESNGTTKTSLEVIANVVDLVGSKKQESVPAPTVQSMRGLSARKAPEPKQSTYGTKNQEFDDPIPF